MEVQVVGAGALNQAVKAIAIARGYMATSGLDLNCRPTFADIRIDGENRTAIRLHVESCPALTSAAAASTPAVHPVEVRTDASMSDGLASGPARAGQPLPPD